MLMALCFYMHLSPNIKVLQFQKFETYVHNSHSFQQMRAVNSNALRALQLDKLHINPAHYLTANTLEIQFFHRTT